MTTLSKNTGFTFIAGSEYFSHEITNSVYHEFTKKFEASLTSDGVRQRSYLKLKWDRKANHISIAENQNYFQSKMSNSDDGGKIRSFSQINADVLMSPVMTTILKKNIDIIKNNEQLNDYPDLTLGIHFIRYSVCKPGASYSSPVGLHVDDEPLVFVHLIELSSNAIGGDNLIANLSNQEITHVVRLENRLDTLCLTQEVYHAVTPLGSSENIANRDVILFTVEPNSTQKKDN